MLLAVDVGNTQTVFGVFEGKTLAASLRVATDLQKTEDEYALILDAFLAQRDRKGKINGVAIANVVPPLAPAFEALARRRFGVEPLVVRAGVKTGVPILYDNPLEVGADRIVNAVAVCRLYRVPAVVVDFGTATTFDVITAGKEYAGGIIAPGLTLSAETLFAHASRLPRVEIAPPSKTVATNTIESIQAGLYHGYVGLVEGVLEKIREERKEDFFVVATGGQASLIAPSVPAIEKVDPDLTLQGLRILYEKNRS
jgi:type III pantothenate kinase